MRHRIRAAVILVKEQKILLVKHVHPIIGNEWWVPPGGGVEEIDKSIFDCAKRETWEETGYTIERKEIQYIREFIDHELDAQNLEVFVKGEVIGGEITLENIFGKGQDEHYIKAVEWIDRENLRDLTVYPEILKEDEFWDDIKKDNMPTKYLGKTEGDRDGN
ncbi:NUDIX hydrolase [Tepidibacillus marianensis]|uniref:NUDIX hydrolase n=1 Tax=Tepidibacillus marianensis TaxID=3131995 RepID=UPI0030CEE472